MTAAEVKDGAYAIRDGLLAVRRGAIFEKAKVPASTAWRIRGMLAVRDAVRMVFRTQLDDAPDESIAEARKLLNELYDSFVGRYGPLSSRDNVKAFAGDPDQPLLLSLETYDPHTKRAAKTAIFERRTLERYKPVDHVETAAEALAVSLNETGDLHWPRMEQVTGRGAKALQNELGGLVYRNPGGRGVGDCRPVFERRCAPQTQNRGGCGGSRSGLRAQYRCAPIRAARPTWSPAISRPGWARRGFRRATCGISSPSCSIAPRHVQVGHAAAIATWTVDHRRRRKMERRQHDDARHGAVSGDGPDRAGAERTRAHGL